jgi:diaminopimelate epimerase
VGGDEGEGGDLFTPSLALPRQRGREILVDWRIRSAMKIPFMKMSGSGNDFILIDHREPFLKEDRLKEFIRKVCHRRVSIGADGFILIEGSEKADFKWRYYNADGSEAEMCGNGGRCAARFAQLKGITGPSLKFETLAGILSAQVNGEKVKLEMTKPFGLKLDETIFIDGEERIFSRINTGVPHAVFFVEDLEGLDVLRIGRTVRYDPYFKPSGTNADFVRLEKGPQLSIRTYERGVEGETLACGTGVVAAALVAAFKGLVQSPVSIKTRGGEVLTVHFEIEAKEVKRVFFEGDVHIIYEAEMWEEAYQ